jgi:Ca-activated chloride channel family protein
VKVQVEFNPGRVSAYRLLGYENRRLRDEEFTDDRKDAGDVGAGHSVTALYEVVPVGAALPGSAGDVEPLRYQRPAGRATDAATGDELMLVKLRYKQPAGSRSRALRHVVLDRPAPLSEDFTFAAAVAAFGMILRDSPFRGSATVDDVIAAAERTAGDDPGGYRAEFVGLARTYRELTRRTVAERDP